MPYLINTPVSEDWLVDLIRCRYLDNSCNPEDGLDCKGLLVHVYNKLGYPISNDSLMSWRSHLEEVPKSEWCNVDRYWGIAFENELGVITHVGVAVSKTDFVHACSRFRSVVCEPIARYPMISVMGRPKGPRP